jgi:hypothetical protein
MHTEFWLENLKGRNNLKTLGAGRANIKVDLENIWFK